MGRTSDFYRSRAEESRAMAEDARDDQARSILSDIAEQYLELARRAEVRDK
jgi:hypothetical protein